MFGGNEGITVPLYELDNGLKLKIYISIGTVKECKEAVEKQKPMKPKNPRKDGRYWDCPMCGTEIKNIASPQKYCSECGQKLDWAEVEQ